MTVLAGAAGVPEQGTLLCERLRSRLRRAAIAARPAAAPRHPPPRVAALCRFDPGALTLAGLWVPEMLELAGGAPSADAPSPGEPHRRVEWSALQRSAPQVLLLCSPGESAQEAAAATGALGALPGWWGLPAVRAGRVYVLDGALLADAGVELVEGVELLAHILAPPDAPRRPTPPPAAAGGAEAPRALRLTLQGNQRCRPRLLPNFFAPLA